MTVKRWRFLLVLSFILLVVFRLPSLIEPKWYGDEGVYAALGHHLNAGKVLYQETWDHKPPLIYWIYALADQFGTCNQTAVRVLNLVFSVLSSLVLFKVVKNLCRDAKSCVSTTYLSAILLNIALATPVFEANVANAENFFILFTLLGFWLVLKEKSKFLFLGGGMFALASLTKIPPMFEFLGILIFLAVEFLLEVRPPRRSDLLRVFKRFFWIGLGFLTPWILVSGYFAYKKAFYDFIFASFLFGLFYIKDAATAWIIPNVLASTMLSRGVVLGLTVGVVSILRFKGKISKPVFGGIVWFGMAMFASLLSTRPYPHYILEVIPPFVFLTAVLLANKDDPSKKDLPYLRYLKLGGFILSSWFLLNVFTNWTPYRSYNPKNYYQLFWGRYIAKNVAQNELNNAFDSRVNLSYNLKSYLEDNYQEAQNVFIYDSFPWLFDIANVYSPVRFVTSYHIFWQDWHREATITDLAKNPPDLVVIKEEVEVDPWFEEYLLNNYTYQQKYLGYKFYLPRFYYVAEM